MAYTNFEFNDGPDVRGFQLEAGRVKLYKGGSMPAQTSSTVTQSNLPAYAEPYVQDIMSRAQAQSYRPYTPYEGQRIAGFSDAQQAAQQETLGLGTPGQFGAAGAGLGGATMMGLESGAQGLSAGIPGVMQGAGMGYGTAGAGIGAMFSDPSAYMSPFMQNVVDVQKEQALRDAQKGQLVSNLSAAQQGTYGGARQLLASTERERNLGFTQNKIQQEGLQNAYSAAMARQQALGQMGMQGLQAGLSGYGGLVQQGMGGIQAGISGAQALGQLGSAEQAANLQRLQGQYNVGAQQQGLQQQQQDTAYADFLRQRDYPMEQLGYYQNLVRGMPLQMGSTATTYATPPSMSSQLAGAGLAALGTAGLSTN
jgi:hypothetical protein